MRNKFRLSLLSAWLPLLLLSLLLGTLPVSASPLNRDTVTDPDTGYEAVIEDGADLLSSQEEQDLLEEMRAITAYGNVMLYTTDSNPSSAESLAFDLYDQRWGGASGLLFLIDMDNRMIYMECDGAIYKVITSSYAETITDNVYTYASAGDYYGCSSEAFAEALILLEGGRIARPMKYISIALFSLVAAALINFLILKHQRNKVKTPQAAPGVTLKATHITAAAAGLLLTKSVILTHSSGGSGGGGHGGGGGGGHSGGGGGHSF